MRRKKIEVDESIRILLVDDDEKLLDAVSHMLTTKGYYCKTTGHADETIETIKKENIDILIIDYLMVEITGLQIVKQVREFNQDIYIVLLTTHVDLMPPVKALLNYDIDSYSEKSADFNDLMQKVLIATKTIKKFQKYNSDTNLQNFPKNLKRMRARQNMTQEQLGDILGVTRSTIANYEAGINRPSIKQMQKLAEYFGVSIDYLLGDEIVS
ncbi:MAG: helix-turn-helix domain-containing protein [Clostridiales bacterium]